MFAANEISQVLVVFTHFLCVAFTKSLPPPRAHARARRPFLQSIITTKSKSLSAALLRELVKEMPADKRLSFQTRVANARTKEAIESLLEDYAARLERLVLPHARSREMDLQQVKKVCNAVCGGVYTAVRGFKVVHPSYAVCMTYFFCLALKLLYSVYSMYQRDASSPLSVSSVIFFFIADGCRNAPVVYDERAKVDTAE